MAIYTPSGKAREYSPLALNIYDSCDHGCIYCYAPGARRMSSDAFFVHPTPRKDIVGKVRRYLDVHDVKEQVLLSFIGDPYSSSASDGNETVSEIIELFIKKNIPYAILTKGGYRCLKDVDLFKRSNCMIGATLTALDEEVSLRWEPNAAKPSERLAALRKLHDAGIRTFASFEPVFDVAESLAVMRVAAELDIVDLFKVGKLNNFRGLDKGIDWHDFCMSSLRMLRQYDKEIYIKDDLAAFCNPMVFKPSERDADLHTVRRG